MMANGAVQSLERGAPGLVVLASGLGLLVGFSFIGQPVGIFIPLFSIILILTLAAQTRAQEGRSFGRNLWLLLLILFFSVMAAVRAAGFGTFLNLGSILILLVWLAYSFPGLDLHTQSFFDYLWRPLSSLFEMSFARPGMALGVSWKQWQNNRSGAAQILPALRGMILAAPVVIIFTLLLVSADPIFGKQVGNFLKFIHLDNLPEAIARLVISSLAAWFVLGGLAYALRPLTKEIHPEGDSSQPGKGLFNFTEAGVVLGSVDALFAAFVVVQFRYFFGGRSNINLEGFTYAEYVRRGFTELVIVAVFSLGLGLILQSWTRRKSRSDVAGFEILAVLLVGLTGVILASAFKRLLLYEEAYGFTQLRTYVHVFMTWLGLLLVVFIVTLHFNRPRLFLFGLFLAFFGFCATLNILNTDVFIVRSNLARYAQSGKLDAEYLATLSEDAVPDLLRAMEWVGPSEKLVLGSALHYRLDALDALHKRLDWGGWHLARFRAYQLLKQAENDLEQYEPRRYEWTIPID